MITHIADGYKKQPPPILKCECICICVCVLCICICARTHTHMWIDVGFLLEYPATLASRQGSLTKPDWLSDKASLTVSQLACSEEPSLPPEASMTRGLSWPPSI